MITANCRVGYSGVPGAYAHIASSRIFPESVFFSCPSFGSVYRAVVEGDLDYGVLPIENSFAGDVAQVMDLLYFGDLYIIGIYELPVTHHLLGCEGAKAEDIRVVYSHPQALDQCSSYIKLNGYEKRAATNTAVAANEVARAKDPTIAAIASKETADIYGLKILDREINDSSDNNTRFVVIARKNEPLLGVREEFSIILTVKHEAGAFAKAVTTIGNEGFNMRAIRSRPAKVLAWQYYFYIEGEGDLYGERGSRMMEKLKSDCETIRILGNYARNVLLE